MNFLLATAALLAAVSNPGHMYLKGHGEVIECLNEKDSPNLTCVRLGTERWAVEENFNRPIGSIVELEFKMQMVSADDGDTYRVVDVRTIPMGEGDPDYK